MRKFANSAISLRQIQRSGIHDFSHSLFSSSVFGLRSLISKHSYTFQYPLRNTCSRAFRTVRSDFPPHKRSSLINRLTQTVTAASVYTMPRYLRTTAELLELPAYFELLATVPYIEIDDTASHDNCGICTEPFRWQRLPGEAINQPVRLFCGHLFGIQYLAQVVFSPVFEGCCPFCRKILLDPTRPVVRHPKLDIIRAQLGLLTLFQGQIPARTKTALQSCFRKSITGQWSVESLPEEVLNALEDNHRLTMLWEELLDTMCEEPETEAEQHVRAQLVNQDIQNQGNRNQRNQIAPEHLAATLRFLETPLRLLAALLQSMEALIQLFATTLD